LASKVTFAKPFGALSDYCSLALICCSYGLWSFFFYFFSL